MQKRLLILLCLFAAKSSTFTATTRSCTRAGWQQKTSSNSNFNNKNRRRRIALKQTSNDVTTESNVKTSKDTIIPAEQPLPLLLADSDGRTSSSKIISLSKKQSAQTLAYRASLFGVTAAYGSQLILPVLQDAGLAVSNEIIPATLLSILAVECTTAACALAPKTIRQRRNKSSLVIDGKVLAAAMATAISGELLVGLAALFVREIYYFGAAYKFEAVLGVAAALAVLFTQQNDSNSDAVGLESVVVWLSLAVMVFGKLFEPLEEDWHQSKSEFLAKGAMARPNTMSSSSQNHDNINGNSSKELKQPPLSPRIVMDLEEIHAMTRIIDNVSEDAKYRSGIATLRSSAHRVKAKRRKQQNSKPNNNKSGFAEDKTATLPTILSSEEKVFAYDRSKYNLQQRFADVLKKCDPDVVGSFGRTSSEGEGNQRLEDFQLPTSTLQRKVNGGRCESAQEYMSNAVATDMDFLQAFDQLVEEVILPNLKQQLIEAGETKADEELSFYIQRPPTLRLQPGPGRAGVKPHCDKEYGHQQGELNFWLPLTDRTLTGVDLWCESSFQKSDYRPIEAQVGEIISFHGSSCRHFVNRNDSNNTRVSMDFRIGLEGFFDPGWQMDGTSDDHSRREVRL